MKTFLSLIVSLMLMGTAFAGTVPLSISQTTAFQALGFRCGYIKVNEHASGFNAAGLPTADVYLYTQCSAGGRGGHMTIHAQWVSVTWDLGGTLVSVVDEAAVVNDPTAVFTNGGYTEYTQNNTYELVPGDIYVYSTAILETP